MDYYENNEQNPFFLKVDALKDLIESFKNIVMNKALQERQFLVYNGKLKMDNAEQNKSIEIKISFIQHYENNSIVLIFRNTTQRDLLVALEEANKYKDQLLASVSHELRAPLNGNINLVETAVNSPIIPENIKENLLVPALRSSKFLLNIINDILDMSQIKEKKLRLTFQSGDLQGTLKSTAQLIELQAKKKGIELSIELDPNLPRSFCTDHIRLSQIVLNLLNNAMKFTKEGIVKMTATPIRNTNWVEICVEDSGIGMSQENVKKLFTHYTHIEFEGRQKMNPTGVGLGLNIAHNLSELLAPQGHQGISVVSMPNQGSTFKFVIENKQKAEDFNNEIAEERPGVIKPIFKAKINRNNSMKRECTCSKVLIVDDNPFNTMAFETILNSLEVKCDSVYSGSSAIKKILNREENKCGKNCKSYTLVFMDQEMPEMSGAEAVREIRRLQGEKVVSNMRFVRCTAHQSKEEVDRFLEAGLDLCIHKPISTIMIKEILKESFG